MLEFLNHIEGASLLVAGEVGIDEYVWGDTRRISPEAPVPIVEVDKVTYRLGLAGNVAQNLVSLGARTKLLTVCGEDEDSVHLKRMVGGAGVQDCDFIVDTSRPTLRKVRIIAQKQHMVRVDYERSHPLDAKLAKKFTEHLCDSLSSCDGVIVQDYGKGLWNPDTMVFVREAKLKKKPVFVDPSRVSPLSLYQGVTLLTPNMVEAEALCSEPPARDKNFDRDRLERIARKILDATQAEHSIVTCGPFGMVSVSQTNRDLQQIPTFARQVFDVTGAGDTVIAVLSLMSVLGHPLDFCMQVANAAAGLVVGQIGAAAVTKSELKAELERLIEVGLIK